MTELMVVSKMQQPGYKPPSTMADDIRDAVIGAGYKFRKAGEGE